MITTDIIAKLSQFGLKTEADVLAFRNSQLGELKESKLNEALLEYEQLQNQETEQAIHHQKLIQMLIAVICLYALEENAEAKEFLEKITTSVENEIKQLQEHIEAIDKEDTERHHANEQEQDDTRYQQALEGYKQSQEPDNSSAIQNVLNDINDPTQDKITILESNLNASINTSTATQSTEDTTTLNSANASNDGIYKTINDLSLQQIHINALKQQLSLNRNEAHEFNREPKHQSFIVPNHKKIVEDNGKLYLLNADEDLGPDNREQARKDYKENKLDLLNAKSVIESQLKTNELKTIILKELSTELPKPQMTTSAANNVSTETATAVPTPKPQPQEKPPIAQRMFFKSVPDTISAKDARELIKMIQDNPNQFQDRPHLAANIQKMIDSMPDTTMAIKPNMKERLMILQIQRNAPQLMNNWPPKPEMK